MIEIKRINRLSINNSPTDIYNILDDDTIKCNGYAHADRSGKFQRGAIVLPFSKRIL